MRLYRASDHKRPNLQVLISQQGLKGSRYQRGEQNSRFERQHHLSLKTMDAVIRVFAEKYHQTQALRNRSLVAPDFAAKSPSRSCLWANQGTSTGSNTIVLAMPITVKISGPVHSITERDYSPELDRTRVIRTHLSHCGRPHITTQRHASKPSDNMP
jgi:hypothetical protein